MNYEKYGNEICFICFLLRKYIIIRDQTDIVYIKKKQWCDLHIPFTVQFC